MRLPSWMDSGGAGSLSLWVRIKCPSPFTLNANIPGLSSVTTETPSSPGIPFVAFVSLIAFGALRADEVAVVQLLLYLFDDGLRCVGLFLGIFRRLVRRVYRVVGLCNQSGKALLIGQFSRVQPFRTANFGGRIRYRPPVPRCCRCRESPRTGGWFPSRRRRSSFAEAGPWPADFPRLQNP